MKATVACLAALIAVSLAASDARAQYAYPPPGYYPPQAYYPPRVAPDMCGPGIIYHDGCAWHLPSYCVYPPFAPFNGMRPNFPTPAQFGDQQGGGMGNVALPVNPWIRSPRDFFMWGEAQQERHTREVRPPFVP